MSRPRSAIRPDWPDSFLSPIRRAVQNHVISGRVFYCSITRPVHSSAHTDMPGGGDLGRTVLARHCDTRGFNVRRGLGAFPAPCAPGVCCASPQLMQVSTGEIVRPNRIAARRPRSGGSIQRPLSNRLGPLAPPTGPATERLWPAHYSSTQDRSHTDSTRR